MLNDLRTDSRSDCKMRNIHQFFKKYYQERINCATLKSGRKALCWYPSAGTDFRHIRMLEEEGLNDSAIGPPMIYLHTDVRIPEEWDTAKKPPAKDQLLVVGNEAAPGMKIANVTEIHAKRIIDRFSRGVCYGSADRDTGRVFLVEISIDITFNGRLTRVPVPVLYFIAENLSFLVHLGHANTNALL